MPVGDGPARRRDEQAASQVVDEDGTEGEPSHGGQERSRRRPEGDAVSDAGQEEEGALHGGEGRIVPGPVVLGLLPVVGGLVHPLGLEGEQGAHLVEG